MPSHAEDLVDELAKEGVPARVEGSAIRLKTTRPTFGQGIAAILFVIALLSFIVAIIVIPIILIWKLSWWWLIGAVATTSVIAVSGIAYSLLKQSLGYEDLLVNLQTKRVRIGSWSASFEEVVTIREEGGHGGSALVFHTRGSSSKPRRFNSPDVGDSNLTVLVNQLARLIRCGAGRE